MSLKLLLFVGLVALSAIEAKHFLKKLQEKDLVKPFAAISSEKAIQNLRRRREVEEVSNSTELTEEDATNLAKFFVALAWEGDKYDVLKGFLEEVSDTDNNVTIVGWQRVLDEQGKVQEIRTLQLVIPPKPEEDKPGNIVQDNDDDDDDEESDRVLPHDDIKEMRELFEPMDLVGIPASITMEEYDEEGELQHLLYLDKDELYFSADGFAVYNKTAVATPQEVSEFVNSLKPAALGKPSVLKYDVDGKLIVEQSNIRPQILGSVIDFYEAPDNILREGPEIIAKISQQYPQENIAKQLGVYYNKAYPEYKWRVLVDPENYYITRDVAITLTYDNFDFDENSDISYLVYGVKKASK